MGTWTPNCWGKGRALVWFWHFGMIDSHSPLFCTLLFTCEYSRSSRIRRRLFQRNWCQSKSWARWHWTGIPASSSQRLSKSRTWRRTSFLESTSAMTPCSREETSLIWIHSCRVWGVLTSMVLFLSFSFPLWTISLLTLSTDLPINRPVCPVFNNQRDGHMRYRICPATVNYFPNRLQQTKCATPEEGAFVSYAEKINAVKVWAPFSASPSSSSLFINSHSFIDLFIGACTWTQIPREIQPSYTVLQFSHPSREGSPRVRRVLWIGKDWRG